MLRFALLCFALLLDSLTLTTNCYLPDENLINCQHNYKKKTSLQRRWNATTSVQQTAHTHCAMQPSAQNHMQFINN
jgi:hypothetical protein